MKDLLILFVHGLGANSDNTWGQFRHLIEQDKDLGPLADVGFFGFKTKKIRWLPFPSSRKQSVSNLAKGLRTEIDERYGHYPQVVLVGHSMGGLIIRRYLVSEVKEEKPLRVNKVMLFAVPNQGSEFAAVANLISRVHEQLADLTPDSSFLETLNEDWHRLKVDKRVDVTHVVAGLDEAVRLQSAVGLWGSENVKVVHDKSHSELVSVTGVSDLAFVILRKAVLDFVRRLGESFSQPESQVARVTNPAAPSLDELYQQVLVRLEENRLVKHQHGPESPSAHNDPYGQGAARWRDLKADVILPNNAAIIKMLEARRAELPPGILTKYFEFKLHQQALELGPSDGMLNDQPRFPAGFESVLRAALRLPERPGQTTDRVDTTVTRVKAFEAGLRHHKAIADFSQRGALYFVALNVGGRLTIVLVDALKVDENIFRSEHGTWSAGEYNEHTGRWTGSMYAIGRNDVNEIVDAFKSDDIQIIVTLSSYSQYTQRAVEVAESYNIRLMSGDQFFDWLTTEMKR